MVTVRKLVFAVFFFAIFATGVGRGVVQAAGRVQTCDEAYPSFCFDDEPFTWCNDQNCAGGTPPYYLPAGFNADCQPTYYESCGDENPSFCDDMFELCQDICGGSSVTGYFGTGVYDYSCSQAYDCEATCACWYCIEA